jgi:hypothetical protein
MKFKDGYMVSSGDPTRLYIDAAVRHVMLRQGVLGIKVRGCLAVCQVYATQSGRLLASTVLLFSPGRVGCELPEVCCG